MRIMFFISIYFLRINPTYNFVFDTPQFYSENILDNEPLEASVAQIIVRRSLNWNNEWDLLLHDCPSTREIILKDVEKLGQYESTTKQSIMHALYTSFIANRALATNLTAG